MSLSGLHNTVNGIGNTVSGAQSALGRLASGSYWSQLRPASWRGVPFGVFNAEASFGRRNAVHQYPYRDSVWVEDLGKSARKIEITGFLIGDDVIAQRDRLIKACESPGDGDLIHPTLGKRAVSLLSASQQERWDQGRVFEIRLTFIEGSKREFPTNATSTGGAVQGAAAKSFLDAASDFVARVVTPLQQGLAVANEAIATAKGYTDRITQLVRDATGIFHLASGLTGNYGRNIRYAAFTNSTARQPASAATIQSLVGKGAVARQNTAAAISALGTTGALLQASTAGGYANAVQNVVTVAAAASVRPIDTITMMTTITSISSSPWTPSTAVGAAMATMQSAVSDLFVRAAVASMAQASAAYQPTSSGDAAAMRNAVISVIDVAILTAGNQGADATFSSLRALRAAVVQDLNSRGAALPEMMDVALGSNLPAPVLAYRFYQDVNRSDELVMEASPVHPAFMPRTMRILSA